jgi:hypothetical protein
MLSSQLLRGWCAARRRRVLTWWRCMASHTLTRNGRSSRTVLWVALHERAQVEVGQPSGGPSRGRRKCVRTKRPASRM